MPLILTLPRSQSLSLPESGCWAVDSLDFLQAARWQQRTQAEHNEAYLQPIVYLLLRSATGQIWCYQRMGGDARLDGRCSCGVGGHVDAQDAQPPLTPCETINTINSDSCSRFIRKGYSHETSLNPETTLEHALWRELTEEIGASAADLADLRLRGLIYEGLSPIGRVHLGVLFTAHWLPEKAPQPVAGEALAGLGFQDAKDIADNPQFELWSRLAAQSLI